MMTFDDTVEGDVRILTLNGQISDREMSELADYVTGLIGENEGVKVVLDLGQVRWLNSMAFGVLTSLLQRLRKVSGDLKLAKAHDHVISVFVQTQLIKIFDLYDTVEEAVASFNEV
ncbi:MAG: anti-sigma factor antagonist [Candidatus Latescibacteria bacterium]|jgi:anti-sigma B factor antagonist|nr:anti-sigma factor antagonist [Candidatus Latescibacterota bacterium]